METELEELRAENARMRTILSEWGIGGGPPIQIAKTKISPINTTAKDTLVCAWETSRSDPEGLEVADGTRIRRLLAPIPPGVDKVDTVCIYSFSDALGFTNAVCGVFGSEKK